MIQGDHRMVEQSVTLDADTKVGELPTGTERILYTFAYWTDNETTLTAIDDNALIVNGKTYFAVWKLSDDAVVLDYDSSKVDLTIIYNPASKLTLTTVSALATVSAKNATECSATVSPEFFVLTTEVQVVTVTMDVNQYTVRFVYYTAGGAQTSETQTLDYGAMPVAPSVVGYSTAEKQYTFIGWDADIAPVTANATYTAVYTETDCTYDILFRANGGEFADGSLEKLVTVLYREAPVCETPTKGKSTFLGWGLTATASSSVTPTAPAVNYNETYYAIWDTPIEYGDSVWDGASVDTDFFTDSQGRYVIESAAKLAGLAELVNNQSLATKGKVYIVCANLDMASYTFTPIGTSGNAFRGTFDGGNYTVSHLKITATQKAGLFGYVLGEAKIRNVYIKDSSVGSVSSTIYVGAVVAQAVGTSASAPAVIENCHVSGSRITGSPSGSRVGGILGEGSYAVVTGCSVRSSAESPTSVTGGQGVGGIAGAFGIHVSGSSTSASFMGISECYNAATVTSQYNGGAGGIVGAVYHSANSNDYIMNSYNVGSVQSMDANASNASGGAGGIIGYMRTSTPTLSYCYNVGAVTASAASGYAGGLIGYGIGIGNTKLINCMVMDTVIGGNASSGRAYTLYGNGSVNTVMNCYSQNVTLAAKYTYSQGDTASGYNSVAWDATVWDTSADRPILKTNPEW